MMEAFCGTWNQVDSVNFDELFTKLGADPCIIEKAKTPVAIVISQDGDTIGVNINKKHQVFAKLGEEFDQTTPDGRCAKTTLRMEGDKLVKKQEWDGKEMIIEKEIKDGKMVVTLTCEGVTADFTFEKA